MILLKPLANRVFVRPEMPKELAGSIHIPEVVVARMRPTRGVVLASHRTVQDLAPGDTVFWPKYAGVLSYQDKEPLMVLLSSEIWGSISAPDAEVDDSGEPRPWDIWVELPQEFQPTTIVLPNNSRQTLSVLGVIRAVGSSFEGDSDFEPGLRVVLGNVPTRRLPISKASDPVFAVRREEVLGVYHGDAHSNVSAGESYPLGRFPVDMDPAALVEALRATGGVFTQRGQEE